MVVSFILVEEAKLNGENHQPPVGIVTILINWESNWVHTVMCRIQTHNLSVDRLVIQLPKPFSNQGPSETFYMWKMTYLFDISSILFHGNFFNSTLKVEEMFYVKTSTLFKTCPWWIFWVNLKRNKTKKYYTGWQTIISSFLYNRLSGVSLLQYMYL